MTYTRIARALDRFFGVDTSYIMRGSFWLVGGTGISMGVAFFLSLVYARFLPKEVYGDYRYILTVLNMAGIFALSGMGTAITRAAARGFDRTFLRGAKIMTFSSIGATIVGIALAGYFFFVGKSGLGWGFLIASPFVPFFEGLGNWRGYLDGKKEFRKKTYYNAITHAMYGFVMASAIGAILLLRLSNEASVAVLAGAYFAAHAVTNMIFFWKAVGLVPHGASGEAGALRYGIHLSLSNIPSTIATYLDGILLFHFLGPVAVATYSFAVALPEQIKSVIGTVATVALPKISEKTIPEEIRAFKETFPRKIFKATLLTLLIVIFYYTSAPLIYRILFPRYLEAVPLSQIFALSLVLFPLGIFGTAVKVEGNTKKMYFLTVAPPLVQIALLALLIPPFGLWGAVAGRVAGRILNYLLALVLFLL